MRLINSILTWGALTLILVGILLLACRAADYQYQRDYLLGKQCAQHERATR